MNKNKPYRPKGHLAGRLAAVGAPDVPHQAQKRLHGGHALLVDDQGARAAGQVVLCVLACMRRSATWDGDVGTYVAG